MMRSNHGPVVLEVNSSPGLEGIEEATGIDVAGKVIEFLEKPCQGPDQAPDCRNRDQEGLSHEPCRADARADRRSAIRRWRRERAPTSRSTSSGSRAGRGSRFRRSCCTVGATARRSRMSAAVHGDEINGVEIVRRLVGTVRAEELAGTLIMVPVVNQLGFMSGDRYLPDRRDLNRSFPGSTRGLAGRTACAPVHDGDHLPLRLGNRPALGLRRPREPAPDPRRPRRPRYARGRAGVRRAGQPALPDPRWLAARSRDRGGDDDAALRGRRGRPLRRLRDRRAPRPASSACWPGWG